MSSTQTNAAPPPAAMHGRVIYLLAAVVIVQVIYPMTTDGTALSNIIYNLLGLSFLVAGVLISRENPTDMRILIGLGVLWGIMFFVYSFNPENTVILLAAYFAYAAFEIMVIKVLMQFVFSARTVSRDVLYAAVAVYFLLGAVFVPIYGTLDTITFAQTGDHAFSDVTIGEDEIFPWQNLIYYSYATLTTLGYGDVLPLTPWARSFASLQAVVGVLYLTIIMARLVSLYVADESESAIEAAVPTERESEAAHAGD
ncbi:MAG: potassium channel family protein [Chloroflexota bacterium]